MLRVLHLHDSPGVQTAPHLLPLGLDLLVGSHHCKWDTGLKEMGENAEKMLEFRSVSSVSNGELWEITFRILVCSLKSSSSSDSASGRW